MLIQNNIPIFVVHHTPNTERKNFIKEQFDKQKLYYEFIEDFLPENIQKPDSNTINIGEYSLYLKFELALKKFLSRDVKHCIVFEDDVLLCNDFKEYFKNFFPQFLDLNGDILMIGTAFNLKPVNTVSSINVYYESHFNTRCAHAVLYTRQGAQTVVDNLHKGIYRGYDHKLNDIISENKLKVCWLEPGLLQGSHRTEPGYKFKSILDAYRNY